VSQTLKPIIYVATIIDTFNYGTVMQAVATRDVLQNYGRPVFVDYYRPQWTPEGHRSFYYTRPGNALVNRVKYVLTSPAWNRQKRVFRTFINSELKLCDAGPYLKGGDFDRTAVYCVGSDQTWNYEDNGGIDPVYFLANVPNDCKKLALSASFGRVSLDKKEARLVRDALQGFDAISVRESSSVGILRSIGLDGIALKDPVLLCRPGLWRELSRLVPEATKPYILLYQLNDNPAMRYYARNVASELGFEARLVTFSPQQTLRECEKFRTVQQPSPAEWLALFRDASYVVTDSFHGTCFSLLFEKPMTVFDPPKYSVRLTDVLRDFGLSERRVIETSDASEVRIHEKPVDWESVRALMSRFSREAQDFLDGCLGSVVDDQ
jgi:hypothetical protein